MNADMRFAPSVSPGMAHGRRLSVVQSGAGCVLRHNLSFAVAFSALLASNRAATWSGTGLAG
jgi:hypothetical protein